MAGRIEEQSIQAVDHRIGTPALAILSIAFIDMSG